MLKIKSLIHSFGRRKAIVFSIITFFSILFVLYYAHTKYRIMSVDVKGYSASAPSLNGLASIKDQNMLLLDEDEVVDIIKKSNSYVKNITLKKNYPDELELHIEYYSPLAILNVKDGFFLLSDDGIILEKSREEFKDKKHPHITYYQNISLSSYQSGQQILFKDIQDSIYFLKKLKSLKIEVNSIDIAGFHMLGLYTSAEEKYYFSSDKEREKQTYQLEKSVRYFKVNGKKYKTLDLRFDKPVVTF